MRRGDRVTTRASAGPIGMVLLLLPIAAASAPPAPAWEVLQDDQVRVACEQDRGPRWCTATALIAVRPDTVVAIVDDPNRFPEHFRSVRAVKELAGDRLELSIAMLPPLPDLGVVVHWTRHDEPGMVTWRFTPPAEKAGALKAEGQLTVQAAAEGTLVRYAWRTKGVLPDFLRDPLAQRHGHNVVWGIALGAGSEPTAAAPPAEPGLAALLGSDLQFPHGQ